MLDHRAAPEHAEQGKLRLRARASGLFCTYAI